ncbi:hypothetical protein [Pseudomonas sp. P1.8]|jgi:hypothetical protein|uniref:DUF6957 family protein n=1 Tax=Pseudomonas sp. P1.8 TaxID=1699310 RepID=UPI00069D4152|nr:hypothetical protein [Pseudomonas sp. P1.8]
MKKTVSGEVDVGRPIQDGLLGDPGVSLIGAELRLDDALMAARRHYKHLPLCAVEDWIILDAIVTDAERAKVIAAGCQPMFLFAHKVVHDEQRRFESGHWVRSSMGTTFKEGFLFATRNSVYVLLGPGHRKSSSIEAIFSIF